MNTVKMCTLLEEFNKGLDDDWEKQDLKKGKGNLHLD